MKCPKCGSELKKRIEEDGYGFGELWYECPKCEYIPTNKEIKETEYQARLDKVLSKFHKQTKNYYVAYGMINYNAVDDKFWIEFDYKPLLISLDTVESLIKDLESAK